MQEDICRWDKDKQYPWMYEIWWETKEATLMSQDHKNYKNTRNKWDYSDLKKKKKNILEDRKRKEPKGGILHRNTFSRLWNTFQRLKLHFFWNFRFFRNFLLWNSFKEYDLNFIICTFRLIWSKLLNICSKSQNQALLTAKQHW